MLVVAPTHEEIRRLTEAIRSDRERAGELGESHSFARHRPLPWTEAQKKDTRQYRAGMVLAFHQATKDVAKHEAVEVIGVEKDKLRVRKEEGQEVTLTKRQAQAFSVYERQAIDVASGDKLLLEGNRRELGFWATNGELVTVARVEGKRIELEDGRVLPGNYRQFDHGYAVTAHRSQGKTVDAVIVAGDRMAQELFYVAATRGRESLTIVTSDKEQLQASIGISAERPSASELAQKAEAARQSSHLPELTVGQTLESARNWVLRRAVSLGQATREKLPEQVIEQALEPAAPQQQLEKQREKQISPGYGIGF